MLTNPETWPNRLLLSSPLSHDLNRLIRDETYSTPQDSNQEMRYQAHLKTLIGMIFVSDSAG